jgi:hypothetical protein
MNATIKCFNCDKEMTDCKLICAKCCPPIEIKTSPKTAYGKCIKCSEVFPDDDLVVLLDNWLLT